MIKTKTFRFFVILFVLIGVFTLSSCGMCSGAKYATKFDEEAATDNLEETVKNKVDWVVNKLDSAIAEDKIKVEELKAKIETATPEEKAEIETQISTIESGYLAKIKEAAKLLILSVSTNEQGEYEFIDAENDYLNINGISGEKEYADAIENYKVQLIASDAILYASYIDNATEFDRNISADYTDALAKEQTSCVSCFFAQTNTPAKNLIKNVSSEKNVYDICAVFTFKVTERSKEQEPLKFHADSVGDFFSNIFTNLFVFPVGWLLYIISKLFGGYYVIGLIITTLLIRTIGWPIYAKTNNMSLKMKSIEPEVAKIQAKYANRKDPDSQRMMQMEQARLYKQNGIGVGGCIMPFLQFPIFMAIYRAISRIPATIATEGTEFTLNWGGELKTNIFNLDLFQDYTAGTAQLIWIIILVVLVAGTQLLSQILSERRQQKAKDKAQEDVPAYRRQAVKQQANDTQRTMKMVMYMMIFMMAVFVWTSKAALGLYWLIGNLYSLLQTHINTKQAEKKLEKLKEQQNGYR